MSINSIGVASKARKVATIFDVLAIVVIIAGVVGALLAAGVGILGLFNDGGVAALMTGVLGVVGVGIYTALIWASISLATVVAGYIAERSAS